MSIRLTDHAEDRAMTIAQLASAIGGQTTTGGALAKDHQTVTYLTTTVNPPIVYYNAVALDGTTQITPRTASGVYKILDGAGFTLYGYDQPKQDDLTDWLAVWDEGVIADFSVNHETFGVSLSGGGGGGGSGLAHAHFTTSQSTSTLLTVDASTSVGDTYAWELDTIPRPETSVTLTFGPLLVGTHHVKLTVTDATDGSTASTERDIDVAWVGLPFTAEQDNFNEAPGNAVDLPTWSTLTKIGPFQQLVIRNEAEGYPGVGDGDPRITQNLDESWTLYVKDADLSNAGVRATMQWNNAYDGRIGLPGEVLDIDAAGRGAGDGHTGSVRFYRVEVLWPSTSPGGANPIPTNGQADILNVFETEVTASSIGTPMFAWTVNAANTFWRMRTTPAVLGVNGTQQIFGHRQIVVDQWVNRVIEIMWDLDPAIGYVRVWEDGNFLTVGAGGGLDAGMPVGTDSQGRYFFTTARTNAGGSLILPSFNYQLYRNVTIINANPGTPDRAMHYRNVAVGPTLASVMAV